jgi:hypothetical protein
MQLEINKRNLSVLILVSCALIFASANTFAMSCKDHFALKGAKNHNLAGPTVPAPRSQEPPVWNLVARRKLNQLDAVISSVQSAKSDTLDSVVEAAAMRINTLGPYGNTRLDSLIQAIVLNPHAVEYRATSFAHNVMYDLAHNSPNADYVVGRFFEAALNAPDESRAQLFANVVFQYGNGNGTLSRYPLYHRVIELLDSSDDLTQRQGKNLMTIISAMSRSRFKDRIRNEHSDEARAYWSIFFETGSPDQVIRLTDVERKSLAATLERVTPALQQTVQYVIAIALLGETAPASAQNALLLAHGRVTAAKIRETQSADYADLWLAQTILGP